MPMGLKNAPSFFQRMMEEVFFSEHPELREFVSVYIDDIIISIVRDGLTEQGLVELHEKQRNIVLKILDKIHSSAAPRRVNYFWKVSNSVTNCSEMGHASRVQGRSSPSRSGGALRSFRSFLDSLAVVVFTILSSRITPSTPPHLLNYSRSVGRLGVRARRCECSGPTSAMRRLYN